MNDIEKLVCGYHRFQQQYFCDHHTLFDSLRESQSPTTLVIGCCDSRVDPMLLTGSKPGELFVVRNIANLVPPCTDDASPGVSSAIEFAVCILEVKRIIVLGHARCGGIRALLAPPEIAAETSFVERWMRIAKPVRDKVLREMAHASSEARHKACEMASILHSLDNLLTYPWLKQRVQEGRLILHGWYFDIGSGALLAYSSRQQEFLPLVCPPDVPAKVRAQAPVGEES